MGTMMVKEPDASWKGTPRMTPAEFARKWLANERPESAASGEHFVDLCRLLGVPTPLEADPTGERYAYEKGTGKVGGGAGYADVWKRGFFAWEYKSKGMDLGKAYAQLLQYREALENPPLLVVCDMERFEVHTNFTGTRKVVHAFDLKRLRDAPEEPLRILRAVMSEPYALKPTETREQITERAATRFAELAGRLQARGMDPQRVAQFLNQLLFCFFAEDVGLLPKKVLTRLVENTRLFPKLFPGQLAELLDKMAKNGGFFGAERIEWFDGGLFSDHDVLPLEHTDLDVIREVSRLDWSSIEPAILGTLFERGLDPAKRRQIGAHYTDLEKIQRVVEPVVLAPVRREYDAMKTRVQALLAEGKKVTRKTPAEKNPRRVLEAFLERLRNLSILDPACGSGNFLYVALRLVKDLEKEALLWASETFVTSIEFPRVGPEIVHGIEINPFAAQLAEVTVWIGELQWMIGNGFPIRQSPILRPLETIECRDAILDRSDAKRPRAAEWPEAEFVIGNPPFLGGKKLRKDLGDAYVNTLFTAWSGSVPREADLVCYWHEKARAMIEHGRAKRAGLLATQGIRGGANRRVLDRIKQTGDIFMAWSDEPWVVEGANVRVSIIGQDDGSENERSLDGTRVEVIHSDLTGGVSAAAVDTTAARPLPENADVAFMGDTKGGPFEIEGGLARKMLIAPTNVNGRPNSDVVVPWVNGLDLTRRPRDMFIIDFPLNVSEEEAALYELPFEHVRREVKPVREQSRTTTAQWWRHERPRPEMRAAISPLPRFLATARVAKHRLFVWLPRGTLPDSAVIAIARADDYALGVLHSRLHELWALHQGTYLEDRPRYTPTSTFETFPFPWPLSRPPATPAEKRAEEAIAFAARELDRLRSTWHNPPELVREEPDVAPHLPPRRVPVNAEAGKELARRTLTRLYNERPAWLARAHDRLDRAVLAAYGWPEDALPDDEILRRLLALHGTR